MFALLVRFELRDAKSARGFDRLVEETGRGIATKEPGTLVYATHTVADAPLARIFYEIYRDQNAFKEHEQQSHTIRFLSERQQYITSTRVEYISPMSTKGLLVE